MVSDMVNATSTGESRAILDQSTITLVNAGTELRSGGPCNIVFARFGSRFRTFGMLIVTACGVQLKPRHVGQSFRKPSDGKNRSIGPIYKQYPVQMGRLLILKSVSFNTFLTERPIAVMVPALWITVGQDGHTLKPLLLTFAGHVQPVYHLMETLQTSVRI
ncbi:MAG: hypothetical protein ACLU4P_06270 [Ruminococcus sp.]